MKVENRSRSAQIKFWVTPEVKRAIQQRARSEASLGEYLEKVALLAGPPTVARGDLIVAVKALYAIRDDMRPAGTPDINQALFELTRLGNLQKHLYSEAKVPIDRIDKVALHLRDAITRLEDGVAAALARPSSYYTAEVLVKIEWAIDAINDNLGLARR